MDIRSWLTGPKGLKKPKVPDVKKAKKHSKLLDSDSEDEEPKPKQSNKENRKRPAPVKEAISPADFFGKKQTTPRTTPPSKKSEKVVEVQKSKKSEKVDDVQKPKKSVKVDDVQKPKKTEKFDDAKKLKKSEKVVQKTKKHSKRVDSNSDDDEPKSKLIDEKSNKKRKASTSPEKVAHGTPIKRKKIAEKSKGTEPAEPMEIEPKLEPDTAAESAPATPSDKKFNYFKYKAKLDQGPSNPGSKEIPTGAENCLEGLIFVLSGVGESLGRDETKSLIERYSGKVTSAVSGTG